MMTIWHKRGELPQGFTEENKLFVYVFDDGSTYIEEYCEQYHKDRELKKWCVFNELCGLEKRLKHTQDLELDVRRKLEIAVKALDKIVNYNSVAEQVDKYHHIVIDVREIGKEALEKIKGID